MTDHLPRRSILRRAAMLAAGGTLSLPSGVAIADSGASAARGSSPADFGADPSGGRDATEALGRWAAQGGDLLLPAGSRFAVSDTIKVNQPGTRIGGRGGLIARPGVIGKALLKVEANDCIIDGINLDNPDRVGVADGLQSFGIELFGHRNRVLNCTVRDFQMCLGVAPTGEYYDNVFAFNHCRVLGAGQFDKGRGEDRGDGIADFGGRTRIIGNMIEAASGNNGINDCRIGIDVEGLAGLEHDGRNPDNSAGSEVIGNVVVPSPDGTGRFRRCYSVEGVAYCRIIGNYGRGWTWDGLWLVGSSNYAIVADNIFRQDLVGHSNSGAEWGPSRAGILIYVAGGVALRDVLVSNNIVDIDSGDYHGIQVYSAGGDISGVVISDNVCTITHRAASTAPCGLVVSKARDVRMTGNRVDGPWTTGISVQTCKDVEVAACRVSGVQGFALSAHDATVRLGQNSIGSCTSGIESVGNAEYLIDGNHLKNILDVGMRLVDGGSGIVSGNISRGTALRVIKQGNTLGAKFIGNVGFSG